MSQSIEKPRRRSWARMLAMFRAVTSAGGSPVRMAAFSAGSPKASYPMGWNTTCPVRRR